MFLTGVQRARERGRDCSLKCVLLEVKSQMGGGGGGGVRFLSHPPTHIHTSRVSHLSPSLLSLQNIFLNKSYFSPPFTVHASQVNKVRPKANLKMEKNKILPSFYNV